MTQDGNHGGASAQETHTALLLHSSSGVAPVHAALPATVEQVDFVPTLALLAGIPIPFNSIGRLISGIHYGQIGMGVA